MLKDTTLFTNETSNNAKAINNLLASKTTAIYNDLFPSVFLTHSVSELSTLITNMNDYYVTNTNGIGSCSDCSLLATMGGWAVDNVNGMQSVFDPMIDTRDSINS